MTLDSALADKQMAGNLGCRQALRSEHRYLALTPAQRSYANVGVSPRPTLAARHEDFDRVNDLLERVEEEAKQDLAIGIIADVDRLAGRLDDLKAMWSIREARATAWTNAEVLWTLQDASPLRERYFDRLDRLTGFAGRGLLLPIVVEK